jgi:hypothetical protein
VDPAWVAGVDVMKGTLSGAGAACTCLSAEIVPGVSHDGAQTIDPGAMGLMPLS